MPRILRKILLCLLILLAAGCSAVPVAQDRTQKQAIEIVSVLNSYGIPAVAGRGSGARSLYTVTVSSGDYAAATSILDERKLINDPRLKDLLEPKGLIPNSREIESLRADYARAVEVEELLFGHPSVNSVKVALQQDRNPRGNENSSGASIVVVVRPGLSIGQEEVRDIVQRAVPGIKRENIVVSIYTNAPQPAHLVLQGVGSEQGRPVAVPLASFLFGWRVAEGDYNQLVFSLLGFLLVAGLLGGVLGYWYGIFRHSMPVQRLSLPEGGQKVSRIEKATRDLPEV